MPSTVLLSWLQALKRCTNVIDSSCRSDRRLTATVMCQGSPRLANQSLWLSLYFLGRNFMAQSWTKKTEFSSNSSITLILASSWLTARRRWAFQAFMLRLACSVLNFNPSNSSLVAATSGRASSISWMLRSVRLQRSHAPSWIWLHASR